MTSPYLLVPLNVFFSHSVSMYCRGFSVNHKQICVWTPIRFRFSEAINRSFWIYELTDGDIWTLESEYRVKHFVRHHGRLFKITTTKQLQKSPQRPNFKRLKAKWILSTSQVLKMKKASTWRQLKEKMLALNWGNEVTSSNTTVTQLLHENSCMESFRPDHFSKASPR